MPITRPSLQTLVTRVTGDIQGGISSPSPLLPVSILSVIAHVIAASCHTIWGYVQYISRQVMPDTAEAEYLERWAAVYGIYRTPATFASGQVQIAGTNGITLPAGTVFVAGGVEYASAADVTVASGTATLSITALTPGSVGTIGFGQVLNLLQPVAGVQPSGTVQSSGLAAAADAETDEALRVRVLARIQNPPQGGSAADYREWILANPDIAPTNAWVYPNYAGPGTVGITFSIAGGGIIPSNPQVETMQAYIEERAPVTATVICFAPTLVTVPLTIHLVPSTAALKAAVQASLANYFADNASPGSTLYLSQIHEAIASVTGVIDHSMTVPNANVVLSASQIGTLGAITWT